MTSFYITRQQCGRNVHDVIINVINNAINVNVINSVDIVCRKKCDI